MIRSGDRCGFYACRKRFPEKKRFGGHTAKLTGFTNGTLRSVRYYAEGKHFPVKKERLPFGSGIHRCRLRRTGEDTPGTSMLITQSPLFLRHLSRNTLKKIPKEKYHAKRISTSVNSWGIIAAPSSLGEGLSNRSTAMKLQGDTEKHFGDCGTIHNTFARLLCCHRLPQK